MSTLRITAPAKLNLFLHIIGKRADGYHMLESCTFFTAFGDALTITPADTVSLTITGNFAPQLAHDANENLVLRAAHLLQARTGTKTGAAITLDKNIPIGAGLGGGSADAAAILSALETFWQCSLTPETRHSIALQLGSDVPACMLNQPAWVTGTGDHVQAIPFPSGGWVVLVNPGTPLLTADVFRATKAPFTPSIARPAPWPNTRALAQWANTQTNALEAPAIALMPSISHILTALQATENCLLHRMSGSGATCFGLYETQSGATIAAASIQTNNPGWWVIATPIQGATHGQTQ